MRDDLKMTYLPTALPKSPEAIAQAPAKQIEELAAFLKSKVEASSLKLEQDHRGDPFLIAPRENLLACLKLMRDDPAFLCTNLEVIAATDFLAQAQEGTEPATENASRIEVVYVVSSYQFKHQFTLKVYLSRENPQVESICELYRAANWYERECYDMFGIEFLGHPNLSRILLPSDWVAFPLRKDYLFPEEYNGMKVPL